MDSNLIKKYYALSRRFPSLCFKFKTTDSNSQNQDSFILGITTNDGPICFKVDYSTYNLFDVRKLYEDYEFASYIEGDINSLNNLNLERVSYFDIEDNKLNLYFGNVEEVVIPDEVKIIRADCFKNNNKISSVKGNNVEEIQHYAFRNNSNLEEISFPKITIMLNLLNIPNLKKLTIGTNLSQIKIEDVLSEDLSITISNGLSECEYTFDSNLEKEFLELTSAIKKEDFEISLATIDENGRRYRFIKENIYDQYDDNIVGICKFENYFSKLPISLKHILENDNYTFWLIKHFEGAGMCIYDTKMLIFDTDNIKISFLHEIGHAIDSHLDFISNSAIFRQIYKEEKEFFYTKTSNRKMLFLCDDCFKHVTESEEEFFAESFQRYFEKDEYFYLECPKTYEFIDSLMRQINDNLGNLESKKNNKVLTMHT